MPQEIRQKYQISAKKSLGQNFLDDKKTLQSIIASTNISNENIIEVGPGYGALTEYIARQNPGSLTLIELDSDMVEILKHRRSHGDFNHIEIDIIERDVLEFTPSVEDYSVIANIPYYITSPILQHFLYQDTAPKEMIILMQKEVADKILGGKKNKNSVIKLMCDKKACVSHVCDVAPHMFTPAPKVWSSVLKFEIHDSNVNVCDKDFLDFIKQAFQMPRKKLSNNLKHMELGKYASMRPEDVSLSEYRELFNTYES